MKLTDRDRAILRSLYDYRYLSTDQLRRLHFPSQQTLNRRIRLLAGGGFLVDSSVPGTAERLLGLSSRGAAVVAEHIGTPMDALEWSRRRAVPTDYYFIKHFLMINDLRIALKSSCELQDGVSLLGFLPEYLGKATPHGRQKRLRDVATDQQGSSITHTPDGVFALRRNGSAALFFLEADRGTEVLSDPNRGYLKMLRFYLNHLAGGEYQKHKRDFDVSTDFALFRVLIVTTSMRRLEHMREAARSVPFQPAHAKRFIWLAAADAINDHNFLTTDWFSVGDDQLYSIL